MKPMEQLLFLNCGTGIGNFSIINNGEMFCLNVETING